MRSEHLIPMEFFYLNIANTPQFFSGIELRVICLIGAFVPPLNIECPIAHGQAYKAIDLYLVLYLY